MTKQLVHRPTRTTYPLEQPKPRELAPPPELGENNSGMPIQMLLPIVGAMSSMVMMVVLRNGRPLFMMLAGVVFVIAIISGVLFAFTSRGRQARQARVKRGYYLDYLENQRLELTAEADRVREQALITDPDPDTLHALLRDPLRRWERRRSDRDFVCPRAGATAQPWFDLTIPPSSDPTEPADRLLLNEAELLRDSHSSIAGMPLQINLRDAAVTTIVGRPADTRSVARCLMAQLATTQSPDDVALAVVCSGNSVQEWAGADLLPHLHEPTLFDGPVPSRRIATTMRELASVLHETIADRISTVATAKRTGGFAGSLPRIVIFSDDHGANAKPLPLPEGAPSLEELGIVMVHLLDDQTHEPGNTSTRLVLNGDASTCDFDIQTDDHYRIEFTPDQMSITALTSLARTMAPMQMSRAVRQDGEEVIEQFDVTDLLGIADPTSLDIERMWRPRTEADFLRVPFAVDDAGNPVSLDLKESAQLGMGPHGICVGATGSGKSEMLRTLILSLAISHPPEDLSMILIDYKGGAAFAPFEHLPHTAGLIDNLADDPQLTTRAKASLQGEVVRRQQLLKDAGSSPNISHYRELRAADPSLAPMPHLFVVIDEFGELLTAEPEFIDLFLQIGRIGRSIGVHLLLSSQRIESGKLRGLDTYLSYRIGLRTFSESESQVVLSTRDAFYLPSMPGYGYLKVDTSIYERFRAGYVSGAISAPKKTQPVISGPEQKVFMLPPLNGIEEDTTEPELPTDTPKATPTSANERVLVDEVVDQLRDDDRSVREVWLPPLPERLNLGQLLDGAEDAASSRGNDLRAIIGLEDRPSDQQQSPWELDFTRAGGNIMVLGRPQSGRSTVMRTIAASLSLTYTPKQVAIYGMDLSGGGLRGIEHFPHVGGVATRADPDRLRRLIEEITAMMHEREQIMRRYGIDSMEELRRRQRRGDLPELKSGDIVLLVDGYGALRQDFESLEDGFNAIMQRASSLGVHLVLTLARQNELRIANHSLFGTKIELTLNDPADSIIERKLAKVITASEPGRALTDQKTFAQVALPLLEDPEDQTVGEALEALARKSAASWEGPFAAPIRLLPNLLPESELPEPVDAPDMVPLGLRQDSMSTAFWQWHDTDPHLLIFGDTKSGKSATLRLIADQLSQRYTPEELAIAVVDPRGHVPDSIDEDYLAAHAKSLQQAGGLSQTIAQELEDRAGRSAQEMESKPHVVIMVDDYDIVSAGGANPLAPLTQHLPMSRDLKFHMIVTRPVAGVSRAMYGGPLQMMRDTGGSVLLLSGDRSEGQILPRIYPERFPPGRGRYVRRGEKPFVVQVARRAGDESAEDDAQ
jgi:S-DNA-T family DNA segregation ATPase FtsK/SpoIIIE